MLREHVGRDVLEDVLGPRDPEVERARERVDEERFHVHGTTTFVSPARAAAAAMQAHRTSCGTCLARTSGVTVSSTRSGVIDPAARGAVAGERAAGGREQLGAALCGARGFVEARAFECERGVAREVLDE